MMSVERVSELSQSSDSYEDEMTTDDGLTERLGHRAEESSPFVTRTRAYGFGVGR